MNLSGECVDNQAGRLMVQAYQFAYAITDRALRVVEIYDPLGIIGPSRDGQYGTLYDVTPELIGSEKIIQEILTGTTSQHELAMVNRERPDHAVNYVTLMLLPYVNPEGLINGVLCIVKDMTESGILQQEIIQQYNESLLLRSQWVKQNEALLQANAELQHLNEMKMQFVSVAAHELRTPLTPILGFLEMMLGGEVGKKGIFRSLLPTTALAFLSKIREKYSARSSARAMPARRVRLARDWD